MWQCFLEFLENNGSLWTGMLLADFATDLIKTVGWMSYII
jgi:hypothetical protein